MPNAPRGITAEIRDLSASAVEANTPPVRIWSGSRTLWLDGYRWQGTYNNALGLWLATINDVVFGPTFPDRTARGGIYLRDGGTRAVLQTDIGNPDVKVGWVESYDRRQTWVRLPRQFHGKLSRGNIVGNLFEFELKTVFELLRFGNPKWIDHATLQEENRANFSGEMLHSIEQVFEIPWPPHPDT